MWADPELLQKEVAEVEKELNLQSPAGVSGEQFICGGEVVMRRSLLTCFRRRKRSSRRVR